MAPRFDQRACRRADVRWIRCISETRAAKEARSARMRRREYPPLMLAVASRMAANIIERSRGGCDAAVRRADSQRRACAARRDRSFIKSTSARRPTKPAGSGGIWIGTARDTSDVLDTIGGIHLYLQDRQRCAFGNNIAKLDCSISPAPGSAIQNRATYGTRSSATARLPDPPVRSLGGLIPRSRCRSGATSSLPAQRVAA
jgi:hypothetical protein